jgi:hypothetical protein
MENGSQSPYRIDIHPASGTYQQFFEVSEKHGSYIKAERYSDIKWHKLFAILGQCRNAASRVREEKGHYPGSWEELLNSGWTPIDKHSINPVTGKPFAGDGRAGDVYYEFVGGRLMLGHVELDGTRLRGGFTY